MLSHVDPAGDHNAVPNSQPTRNEPKPSQHPRHSTQSARPVKTDEEARPRLMISKMVLRNFKSYAGVVEIGPFHKSFTSIVGPNGSGKSNVIDSLLFVFGFKAKKMRQGKLSELIHNSTHQQNLTFCSVEVYFQEIVDLPGPDSFQVVPRSELVISRTVERASTEKGTDKSIYRINERTSTFTEVTTLLKNKGVDLDHKRFLILQGEVESIALMKPKAQNEHEDGLLEYLEDIIGTSRYKQPIDDASIRLDQLNEERTEKLNRLKFVEKDKNSLEAKKDEAEAFIRTENMLTHRKNELFHINMAECTAEVKTNEEAVEALNQHLEDEREKHKDLLDEVKTLEKDHHAIQKEFDTITKKAAAVKDELQKYDRAEVEMKEKETHLQKKKKKLSASIHKESLERSENETWIQNFDSDMQKASAEAETLAARLVVEETTLEEIRESLKGKTEVFQKAIEQKQEELGPWMQRINEKQAGLDVAQSERDILDSKITASKTALKDAEHKVLELRAHYGEKKQQLKTFEAERQEMTHQEKTIESKLAECVKAETELRKKVTKCRASADDAKVTLQAAQNRGKVHTHLMQQSHTGRIQGICGRLGDLGVIDDKYDVAVTTACGALDSIVVDTVEAGQKCIEFLRKQSLGRATFICLDKLTNWDTSPIQTPKNVPRLFDLIKPKHPKYAPAFYHGLRDTLVATNLPEANRIAFGQSKRYKVVTLDGQLIDISGTMSGGGNTVKRGGMSSKFAEDGVTQQQVARLEAERDNAEANIQKTVEKRKALEEQLEESKKALADSAVEVQKLKMDLKSLKESLVDAEDHAETINRHQGPSKEDIARRDELESIIDTATKEIGKLQVSTTKIEEEIAALQQKILEVGGVRLRTQHAKVDSINEQLALNSARMTKLQVERTARDKALAKLLKSIEKNDRELESTESEMEEIGDALEQQRAAAAQVTEKVREAQKVLDEKEAQLEEIKRALDERTDAVNEMRKLEIEVKAQLENAKKIVAQKVAQRKYYRKEIDTNLRIQVTGFEEEDEVTELQELTDEDVEALDKSAIEKEISVLQAKLDEGTPNLSVLAEYKQKLDAYLARAKDLDEMTMTRDQAKKQLDDLRTTRLAEFMEGFTMISQKLKEMYQMITLGGNAELELVDSLDPFSEGIIFSVMPPKKSWKNISNLSGGEKTLSSLALVFALHHFKPTPLYVMDEIDAALDFRNVSIVANYIKERTKNAQFVIISLRNNMFELADRLVGIYKVSKALRKGSLK
ncbi:RecF/RecN/SMC [Powellomyces hirtus]|nr:RecF/RecN/SMC [Powellomyces hirtus]